MGYTARVSLPGYEATTDTNTDHYALFADQDNVLVKELSRGAITAVNGSATTVSHGLGYIPLVLVYYQNGSIWSSISGDINGNFPTTMVDNSFVYFFGPSGGTTSVNFKYFICYDQQV